MIVNNFVNDRSSSEVMAVGFVRHTAACWENYTSVLYYVEVSLVWVWMSWPRENLERSRLERNFKRFSLQRQGLVYKLMLSLIFALHKIKTSHHPMFSCRSYFHAYALLIYYFHDWRNDVTKRSIIYSSLNFEAISLTECATRKTSRSRKGKFWSWSRLKAKMEGLCLISLSRRILNQSREKIGKVSPWSRHEQTFKRLDLALFSKQKVSFSSLMFGCGIIPRQSQAVCHKRDSVLSV